MLQLPLFPVASDWRPPSMADLPSWRRAERVAVDVETRDDLLTTLGPGVRRGGYVVGVAFAVEGGPAHYLPVRHEGGDNLDPVQVVTYLRDQARDFRGELCGAGMQYDLDYLAEEGVLFRRVHRFRDCQVADPLLDELQYNYNLEAICERLGIPGKDEGLLREAARAHRVDPKKDLWRLPARYVGAYAERDVRAPLEALRLQEQRLRAEDLWSIYDLECRLLPVLVKMRRRGVRVDLEELERIRLWAIGQERAALGEVRRLTGVGLTAADLNKKPALARVLQSVGVPYGKTKTGKPRIDQALFKQAEHPAIAALAQAKKMNNLRTNFVKTVLTHQTNGRVHVTFNQLRTTEDDDDGKNSKGVRYGRTSCSDYNLQQQYGRDPVMRRLWRAIYLPDEGGEWLCADYSQQEPRWITHYAALCELPGAREAVRRYVENPATDSHDLMTNLVHPDLTRESQGWDKARTECKQIALGIAYGKGGAAFCRDLGLPTKWIDGRRGFQVEVAGDDGQAILDRFDERVPYMRALSRRCAWKAARSGAIFTVLGRRCQFPKKADGTYDWTHKALNRLIQGSAADQMKKAMVDIDAAGLSLQVQVHDEADTTIYSAEEAREVARLMREAVPCLVPMKVDVEIGPNWGAVEKQEAA